MAALFSGWIGYGTQIVGNTILEPTDAGYTRQPVIFSDLSAYAPSFNLQPFTLGPFTGAQILTCAGIFDAASGGNLVAYWPLISVQQPQAGATQTIAAAVINIRLSGTSGILAVGSVSYMAGQLVGTHNRVSPVTAGVNVTFSS